MALMVFVISILEDIYRSNSVPFKDARMALKGYLIWTAIIAGTFGFGRVFFWILSQSK